MPMSSAAVEAFSDYMDGVRDGLELIKEHSPAIIVAAFAKQIRDECDELREEMRGLFGPKEIRSMIYSRTEALLYHYQSAMDGSIGPYYQGFYYVLLGDRMDELRNLATEIVL